MANKLYSETSIQNIANAIRTQLGSEETFRVGDMASAILSIEGGGGAEVVIDEGTFTVAESAEQTVTVEHNCGGAPQLILISAPTKISGSTTYINGITYVTSELTDDTHTYNRTIASCYNTTNRGGSLKNGIEEITDTTFTTSSETFNATFTYHWLAIYIPSLSE